VYLCAVRERIHLPATTSLGFIVDSLQAEVIEFAKSANMRKITDGCKSRQEQSVSRAYGDRPVAVLLDTPLSNRDVGTHPKGQVRDVLGRVISVR